MSGGGHNHNHRPEHTAEIFDASYQGAKPAPWDIGRPQTAFARLAQAGALTGRVLDVGCGTGEHALLAASLGHAAIGIDISPRAIERATQKATSRHINATFLVYDALRLPELGTPFDTVLDCGLFHGFDDHDQRRFIDSLAQTLSPGGRYHMLCFSDREPGDWGPRRISQGEIRLAFAQGWAIDCIEATVLDLTLQPATAHAWQVTATRK